VKEVEVKNGQTLLDIAVQELGDASRFNEIATLNNLEFSDDLIVGSLILVPESDIDKREIVKIFTNKALTPASDKGDLSEVFEEGIEFWSIEYDFIVS
jgi:hypothetical protein